MDSPRADKGFRPKAPPNRVFVIDDDTEIRGSLRTVLEANGYLVDTFHSAAQFLLSGCATLPGCVLTDVQMPGMTGLELQSALQERGACVAIVMMAGRGIVDVAVRAMKAGAVDFLEKPFSEAKLIESVDRAQSLVSQSVSISSPVVRNRIALLTKREREVFDLIVVGDTNKVVALQLMISPRTVEIHRARAIKKMGAKSIAELVRMSVAGVNTPTQR